MKIPTMVGNDIGIGIGAAIGGVKRPAGVDPTHDNDHEGEQAPQGKEIPAGQIQPWEGEVPRPDHHGHEKVPQHRRDGRD